MIRDSNRLGQLRLVCSHNSVDFLHLVCDLCSRPLQLDEEVVVNPCGHTFHLRCMQGWWSDVR